MQAVFFLSSQYFAGTNFSKYNYENKESEKDYVFQLNKYALEQINSNSPICGRKESRSSALTLSNQRNANYEGYSLCGVMCGV